MVNPLIALKGVHIAANQIKKVVTDHVAKPRVGSLVFCDFFTNTSGHSGIYIGQGLIASLSGSGVVELDTPEEFVDGFRKENTIWVSCKGESPIGKRAVAERAKRAAYGTMDYSLLTENCHTFSHWCLVGGREPRELPERAILLSEVKNTAEEILGADTWRVWDWSD